MKIRKKLINEDLGDIEELDTTAVVPPAMEDQKEKSIDREKELEKQGIVTDAEKIVRETKPVISDSKPKPKNPVEFKTKVNESIDTDNLDQKIDEFVMDIEDGAIKEGVGAALLTAAKFVGTHYEAILAALAAAGITAVELVEDYEKIMKKLDDGKKERQSTIGGADQGDTAIGVTESFNKSDVDVKIGDTIRIDYMEGEPQYTGKTGEVDLIDDIGQIHGTWGGCALCKDYGDKYTVIGHKMEESIENGSLEVGDEIIIDLSVRRPRLSGLKFKVGKIYGDGSFDAVKLGKTGTYDFSNYVTFNPNEGDRYTILNSEKLPDDVEAKRKGKKYDNSLWQRIFDELATFSFQSKFLKKTTLFPNFGFNDRYSEDEIQPCDDGFVVTCNNENDLIFAKKVAERYGLPYETHKTSGGYSCFIHIDRINKNAKDLTKELSKENGEAGTKSDMDPESVLMKDRLTGKIHPEEFGDVEDEPDED